MKKLTPIILILISVGIFFFFTDPQYKQVKELNAKIDENERMIDLAKELESKRQDLRSKFNSISETDRDLLAKIIPDTVDNVRLILNISNIAEDVGILITDIGIDTEEDEKTGENVIDKTTTDDHGTISLSFSVSATYEVFKEFLRRLEDSLRIVDVVDLSVSASEESDFYGFDVTINTYWLR